MDSEQRLNARVDVIVLNYCAAETTLLCLHSLTRLISDVPFHVWMVDNASPDQSGNVLQQWMAENAAAVFPLGGSFIRSPANLGYAGGNNLALRAIQNFCYTGSDHFVWLLNNDTQVLPETLQRLLQGLRDQKLDLVGNKLVLHPSGEIQAYGGFISPITGSSRFIIREEDVSSMNYIVGASLFARYKVFQVCNFLPEDYFLYSEEADFCLGATQRGFRLGCITDAVVLHAQGTSTGGGAARGRVPFFADCLMVRNRFLLARRYLGLATALIGLAPALGNRLRRCQLHRFCTILILVLNPARVPSWIYSQVKGRMHLPAGTRAEHECYTAVPAMRDKASRTEG